jgi:hypothetical protein
VRAMSALSCPIASRFIETREDALSYYAHKLAGDHRLAVRGVAIVVRINAEEIHLFTDCRAPCPPEDVTARAGSSRELRCLSRERARMLDLVLPTIEAPAIALRALIHEGVMLLGPADPVARRQCVVVAPSARVGGVYFVRTAFSVTAKDFAAKLGANKPAPWPPK